MTRRELQTSSNNDQAFRRLVAATILQAVRDYRRNSLQRADAGAWLLSTGREWALLLGFRRDVLMPGSLEELELGKLAWPVFTDREWTSCRRSERERERAEGKGR